MVGECKNKNIQKRLIDAKTKNNRLHVLIGHSVRSVGRLENVQKTLANKKFT